MYIWFQQAEDYTLQISEMQELFRKKSSDFNMIQEGMKKIKEFQKRKAQMEQELSDVRKCFLLKSGFSFCQDVNGTSNHDLLFLVD